LDGLETMEEDGEATMEILIDCTDVITTLVVARHLETDRMPAFFLKEGKAWDEV
jgi:hypothetical protein